MRIGKVLAFLVVLLFAATSAMAGGFRLPEAGAKAMSMGFAFTAQANDPSAIYFNPAGIVQLEGTNAKVGVTYIKANGGTFTGTTPLTGGASVSETQKDLDFFVPNTFITKKVSPNFAYGVGIFAPFGLGQEYENPNTSIFRNQITKIDLMTIVINPTVAWKINGVLSVGAGIDFMYGKAELNKTPFNPALGGNLYNSSLEGDGTAWGYNFGLLLTPSPNWKVGFAHRSGFDLDIKDGDVEIRNISPATSATFFGGATSFDTKGNATARIPATTEFGIAYIRNRLTLEVDASFTWWHSYRNLRVEIKDQIPPVLVTTDSPKNWDDTVAIYVGGEYRVTDPLALRLGFRYDPTPVPADTMGPELPDADKIYYCAGAGYKVRNWTFDLAYMYVDKKDRTVSNSRFEGANPVGFNGKWTGDSHLVAFDVGYKF
jgi:long-chain fatty acid transport protein